MRSLPLEKTSKVQDYVLEGIRFKLVNGGPADFCSPKNSYVGVGGTIFDIYSYASCSEGTDSQVCDDCLVGAAEVIRRYCFNSDGAPASSDKCCIRYESARFCEAH
ncbi:hypothetical protein LINPERPRIM_LOCUS19462 [Linum perenne]